MWLAAFIPLPLDSIYSLFNLLFDRWISGLEFDGGGGITPCYVALPPRDVPFIRNTSKSLRS